MEKSRSDADDGRGAISENAFFRWFKRTYGGSLVLINFSYPEDLVRQQYQFLSIFLEYREIGNYLQFIDQMNISLQVLHQMALHV